MGRDPKVQSLLTGGAGVLLLYSIVTEPETPSMALSVLQYAILAGCIIGFVVAMRQWLAGSDRNPG